VFITFEGIDKSGKTTQARLLADFLKGKGYRVVLTREPAGTEVGEKIKRIILEDSKIFSLTELFLYLADRAQHVHRIIKPSLKKGSIVISDRYADASVAYQGYGRGIDVEFINKLNFRVTNGLLPDVTFLLDLDPEKALLRAERSDRIERERLFFHRRVREGYLEIARKNPERIKVIDANTSASLIHEVVKDILFERFLKDDA